MLKVCFAGSTVAGEPLMITRETLAERTRPEMLTVFASMVDSSIGDSNMMRLPPVVVDDVELGAGVVTVLYAPAPLSFIQSEMSVSGLTDAMRDAMSSGVRVFREE